MSHQPALRSLGARFRSPRVAAAVLCLITLLMASRPALAGDQADELQQGNQYRLEPGVFVYGESSFVAPLAELFGEIYIGDGVFVAGNSILRAAPNNQIRIGSNSNIQDNVIVRALGDSIVIGDGTSITHHAVIRNSQIGANVYVGYYARVTDASIGDGAIVWHGARVEGVNIPANALVGAGQVVDSQAEADALPKVAQRSEEYIARRLESNRAFARGYIDLYENEGYDAVIGVGPNPETEVLPRSSKPNIPDDVELQEFVRVVGDVRVGRGSSIGQRTTIRADEGTPIIIGGNAEVDDRVTFHGIEDTDVRVGEGVTVDDDAVIHGPLTIGDNVMVGEHAVVFDATVGDNVKIGDEAIIATDPGSDAKINIPANSVVPAGAVITGPQDVKKLRRGSTAGSGAGDDGETDNVPSGLPSTGAGGMSTSSTAELGASRDPHTVPDYLVRGSLRLGSRSR